MSQPTPSAPAPARPTPAAGRALTPRIATAAMFALNGVVLATWVVHIPSVRDRLHLSDAGVGTAILGLAVGSMVSMPLSGRWIARWGSAAVTKAFGLLLCLCLPLPFLAASPALLFLALAALGLTNGAMDVAMNAQGVAVERRLGRPVLSGFHAWFSLGNLGGALLGSSLVGLGVRIWPQVLGVTALCLGLVLLAGLRLLPKGADLDGAAAAAAPRPGHRGPPLTGLVLWMGLLCFLGMLGEGATGDWSGLYFRDVLGVGGGLVGLGYSAFTLAMTLGRTFGDRWRGRFGDARLVTLGALLSGLGVLLAALSHSLLPTALGYALTGLGVANVVPVLYGSAGRALSGHGIARVATLGYLGFLAGPPLIGYVSHLWSLRAGLVVIALSLLLVAALGRPVLRRLEGGSGAG